MKILACLCTFTLFLGKILNFIDVSWLVVLAPVGIYCLLVVLLMIIAIIIGAILDIIGAILD